MFNVRIAGLLILAAAAFAAWPVQANPVMGFYKGQTTGGLSKICFYDVLGEEHTLDVPSYALCPVSHEFDVIPPAYSNPPPPPGRSARVGFYKYEEIQGLSKICYYQVLGDIQAITLSATSLCPLQVSF